MSFFNNYFENFKGIKEALKFWDLHVADSVFL